MWPTPNAADGHGARISSDESILSGRRPSGAKLQKTLREEIRRRELVSRRGAPAGRAGSLNPDWVEWLMGFPVGWTDPAGDGARPRRHRSPVSADRPRERSANREPEPLGGGRLRNSESRRES